MAVVVAAAAMASVVADVAVAAALELAVEMFKNVQSSNVHLRGN